MCAIWGDCPSSSHYLGAPDGPFFSNNNMWGATICGRPYRARITHLEGLFLWLVYGIISYFYAPPLVTERSAQTRLPRPLDYFLCTAAQRGYIVD